MRGDKIKFNCCYCGVEFLRSKTLAYQALYKGSKSFCSLVCKRQFFANQRIKFNCHICNKEVYRIKSQFKKSKVDKYFCSKKCAGIFKSQHKTTGYTRSKLELYIEQQLTFIYPDLLILYNDTNAINAELDIYIPSLNLAFELNGIFHYEPIFGKDKLNKTINNDGRKMQACLEKNIELCVIDTTSQKYFKITSAQKFIDIITNIINKKLFLDKQNTCPT